ncbi:hypothetical protein [Methanosarcina sp.]|uniref:hypothetical protein n=1 Tax=Methanosarcina sp. TaxID=2213 RepID=UPI002ABB1806|nr:hypothetical protein [Methanosarcina sp.]MDY9928116.1 hypothetical protein [Methanosarcina sp.]
MTLSSIPLNGSIEALKTSSPVIDPATRTESIKNAKLNIATMRTILIIELMDFPITDVYSQPEHLKIKRNCFLKDRLFIFKNDSLL